MRWISFLYILLFFILSACNSAKDSALEKDLGVIPPSTSAPSTGGADLSLARVVKIVTAGDGNQTEILDVDLDLSTPVSFKAALFDLQGNYQEDVAVTWSFSNSTFPAGDKVLNTGTTGITFTPSFTGVVSIRAVYSTTDTNVINNTDFTGLVTVTDPAEGGILSTLKVLKIVASGAGNQAETLDADLEISDPLNLKASLFDLQGNYLEDVAVTWSFSNATFGAGDRTINTGTTGITFTPDNAGVVSIRAVYSTTDNTVINNSDMTGIITVTDPGAPVGGSANFRILKIIAAGAGNQAIINDHEMDIADSLNVKAALFDTVGNYIEDVAVTWSFSNSTFGVGDRTINSGTTGITFTPDNDGVAMISATYVTADANVILNTDVTGSITVIDPDEPSVFEQLRVLKIIAAGAGNQAEIADETIEIGDDLSVKAALFDTVGNYIEDVAVTWSYSNATFGAGDRTLNSGTTGITFSPDNDGVAMIKATYTTVDANIILNADFTGTITVNDPDAPSSLAALRIFKIVEAGAGDQDVVSDIAAMVGDPESFKAALYDLSGNYIEDAPAIWTFSNSTFPLADLVSSNGGVNGTFTPSRPGTVVVNALYTGGNTSVISPYDSTGVFTVTNIQVPDSVLLIAGNNQSGTVNNNLATQLKMQVLDEFSQGIPGISVTWSVTQGSGSIMGANPVTTDADGYAVVTAKLGTTAGGNNNQYRGIVAGYPALLVDFSATATAGSQDHLTFTTQPSVLFSGMAFGIQPIIELRDLYNNLVSASGTITMTKSAGAGNVSGTTTASMTNGTATFSGLSWNTAESGVVLQASNGTVTGLSNSLTIGSPPPGACVLNDIAFYTALGGCQDQVTGLIWSAKSTSTYTWYEAIWDERFPGAPAADVDDYGRTNDYREGVADCDVGGSYITCDVAGGQYTAQTNAYCKTLNEGGKTDWRVPTQAELMTMANNLGSTHLNGGSVSENVNSTDTYAADGRYSNLVNIVSKTSSTTTAKTGAAKIYCVRGGTRSSTAPTQIVVTSSDVSIGVNHVPVNGITVALRNSANGSVNLGGITLTLSTNLGALGGTTTAITNYLGVATFSAFTLNTTGNATLTISYTGGGLYSLTSTTQNITVGLYKHTCKSESAYFQTANGGCKDMAQGLIWSSGSTSTMSWYSAIWDNTLAGAPATDSDDLGRGSDYSELATEICSSSATNYQVCDNASYNTTFAGSIAGGAYCKSLSESGYTDWRIPTSSEFATSITNGASSHLNIVPSTYFWSSSLTHPDNRYIKTYNITDNLLSSLSANGSNVRNTICVRGGTRNASTKLAVISQPSAIGQNASPLSSFTVRVQDSSSANTYSGSRTITVAATGSAIAGTLTATTDFTGAATFSAFQLNTLGTITLTFSTPGLTDATTTIEVRQGVGSHICSSENVRFKSQYGGCHDNITDLAWSTKSPSAMTWLQAVWDSSVGGSSAADGNDYGRVNDYDPALTLTGSYDTDPVGYCKDLVEGGYSDWRLPTQTDWETVLAAGANTYFMSTIKYQANSGWGCYWTSRSQGANNTFARYVGMSNGVATNSVAKSASATPSTTACDGNSAVKNIYVVCVRDNSP